MIEIIFDVVKEILKIQFFQRLIVVFLLPNILVWGFAEVGIDNKHNFLWTHFVGPYWSFEVFLFKVVFYGGIAALAYSTITFIFRLWREIQNSEPAPRTHQPSGQFYNEDKPQAQTSSPVIAPVRAAPQPTPIQEQKPISPEEAKRRALREITGRGA